jgi:hypothetical protein
MTGVHSGKPINSQSHNFVLPRSSQDCIITSFTDQFMGVEQGRANRVLNLGLLFATKGQRCWDYILTRAAGGCKISPALLNRLILFIRTDEQAHGTTRVFISYSRSDGESFAHRLRTRLESEAIPIWQDRVGMEGGRDWGCKSDSSTTNYPHSNIGRRS